MSARRQTFSERYGYEQAPVLHLGAIPPKLRNSLWNAIYSPLIEGDYTWSKHKWEGFNLRAAATFFRSPLDEVPTEARSESVEWMKSRFMKLPWNHVYDFLEFAIDALPKVSSATQSVCAAMLNNVLEEEASGYRIVESRVVPITSEEEVEAVAEAINVSERTGLVGVHAHLGKAVELFAKRPDPDYLNVIKEAISAVESAVQLITGTKTTLGKALDLLESKGVNIHPAMKQGFDKLYGYTSDSGGIRHAMTDAPTSGVDEARFMLVSCSAFVNWLVAKASAAGIPMKVAP